MNLRREDVPEARSLVGLEGPLLRLHHNPIQVQFLAHFSKNPSFMMRMGRVIVILVGKGSKQDQAAFPLLFRTWISWLFTGFPSYCGFSLGAHSNAEYNW